MSDRQAHWDQIYSDNTPVEVSWFQPEPELSLKLIRNLHLAEDAAVLDVGGGASVLVDRLSSDGFTNLAVLDISAKAIAHARDRLGDIARNISWHVGDVTEFAPAHRYSLWHDRAVFHFLTGKSDRASYVRALHRALEAKGHVIISAFAIGGPSKCSGLDVVQYDADKLLAELGQDFELLEQRDEVHMTPRMKKQEFSYFHCIRR